MKTGQELRVLQFSLALNTEEGWFHTVFIQQLAGDTAIVTVHIFTHCYLRSVDRTKKVAL
jgi:hypothetical protein